MAMKSKTRSLSTPTARGTVEGSLSDGSRLTCPCGASCKNTRKEKKRFLQRHPLLCTERKKFAKQLGATVKSVQLTVNEDTGSYE